MWIVEEVDALVDYKAALTFPILRAINWQRRRINFTTRPRIERATNALLYRFEEGTTRYALRFEPARQRWYLEGVDDSGQVEWPPPRCFAPTMWRH